MTTTKFTMLSTDTSSEVAPVNFIDHLQNFKKKMNKGFAVDVGKKNKIKNNNKKAQYQHTHTQSNKQMQHFGKQNSSGCPV